MALHLPGQRSKSYPHWGCIVGPARPPKGRTLSEDVNVLNCTPDWGEGRGTSLTSRGLVALKATSNQLSPNTNTCDMRLCLVRAGLMSHWASAGGAALAETRSNSPTNSGCCINTKSARIDLTELSRALHIRPGDARVSKNVKPLGSQMFELIHGARRQLGHTKKNLAESKK